MRLPPAGSAAAVPRGEPVSEARRPTLRCVEVLWWLAPAAGVTALAMAWAAWAGRPGREDDAPSEADYERFVAAMTREHPGRRLARPVAVRDRSTGIAVRPSRRA